MSNQVRVGVVGASGYSGAIASRLLIQHPSFRFAFGTSDKLVGRSLDETFSLANPTGMVFSPNGEALALAESCDAVLLATSAEVSANLAPKLLEAGKTVVDLSGAFRLQDPQAYERWYGFTHPCPRLLSKAHYGLPELFGAPPEGTKLVANPGCYPTATLLALGPLVREGLVEAEGIVVDAKSGVTGAGRQAKEEYSFCEVDEDLRAYKLLSHQHTPEIQGALSQFRPSRVTFTAHLLPLRRGLLATCYARPKAGVTTKQAMDCLRDTYLEHFMISVVAPEEATIKGVAGTNLAKVGVTVGEDVVIAVGAIDNLVKGAAGQAIQNLNLLYDLPSTEGLDSLHRYSP